VAQQSWFPSPYINPDALHDVWFQLDEPIAVTFTGSSQLAKDFMRKVEYASEVLANTIGVKFIAITVHPHNELELINDWKINRYPTLLIYDGVEVVRLSEDVDREALVRWVRDNMETTRA
jgi:hypothetical protein